MVTVASVLMDQKDFINPETREAAQQGEEGIITFDQAMIKYYDGVVALKMTGVTKLKWMLEAEIIPPSLIEVEKYSFEGFELMGCKKNGQE